jgi:hypothetical protein
MASLDAYFTLKPVEAKRVKCAVDGCTHDGLTDRPATAVVGPMGRTVTFYLCSECYIKIVYPMNMSKQLETK